ncbi:MAG: glucarate dehydratase [Chitinophagaceae bacterium]|nr:glucarate dehydratase [Rubrivivax sp.]
MNRCRAARIAAVRVTPIALKDPPLLNASGVHQPYALRSIIEIDSDDGAVGLGETYGDDPILSRLQASAPHLAGTSPLDLHAVQSIVRRQAFTADEQATMEQSPGSPAGRTFAKVFGAFEAALADLCARREGVPLATWLGGPVRDRVPYSAYLFYKFAQHAGLPYEADRWGATLDADGIVRQARQMVGEFGFRSIKLKAGVFEPELEADALLALRAAFPHHPLRIDPNGNWSPATAQRIAHRLGRELEYYEDPVPTLADMAALRSSSGLELATNMVVCDEAELRENVRLGAVQTILLDHHAWGGFRATRELATICRVFGMRLSMHSNSHAGISLMAMTHLAASLPELDYACDTHYPWQEEDLLAAGPVRFEDGAVMLPTSPGLGVDLDHGRLGTLHEQYLRCGIRRRDDASEMRKHEPGFVKLKPRY